MDSDPWIRSLKKQERKQVSLAQLKMCTVQQQITSIVTTVVPLCMFALFLFFLSFSSSLHYSYNVITLAVCNTLIVIGYLVNLQTTKYITQAPYTL